MHNTFLILNIFGLKYQMCFVFLIFLHWALIHLSQVTQLEHYKARILICVYLTSDLCS